MFFYVIADDEIRFWSGRKKFSFWALKFLRDPFEPSLKYIERL